MSWDFIHIQRQVFQSDNNWGSLYIKDSKNQWEWLCYSYELPWITFRDGSLAGKSKNSKSRIKIGSYGLKTRSDGAKGWRLELQSTDHRKNIQIHRAHKSMFIKGCILPVTFNNYSRDALSKGNPAIQLQSKSLMEKIQKRHEALSAHNDGNASLMITANLPAMKPATTAQV